MDDTPFFEREFVKLWDVIEHFYQHLVTDPRWAELEPLLDLIAALCPQGYDRRLRAGQSLILFILRMPL